MRLSMKATIPAIIAISLCIPMESQALLGGFESTDGYDQPVLPTMVNSYNAGQYGTTNGGPGGAYTPTSYDAPTGLWDDRNNAYGTYNIGLSAGVPTGYYVTRHPPVPGLGMFPHSGNAMLAVRNTGYNSVTLPAIPLDFSYSLDTRDFYNGGSPVTPTATGDKIVDWSVWAAPGPVTTPNDGIWLSFLDSVGISVFSSAGMKRTNCGTEIRRRVCG